MRTITLKLPDGLAARVSATVRRRGLSTSALVREALEDRLGSEKRGRPGSCLDLAGAGGRPDGSGGPLVEREAPQGLRSLRAVIVDTGPLMRSSITGNRSLGAGDAEVLVFDLA